MKFLAVKHTKNLRIGGGEAGNGAEAGLPVLVINMLQYLVLMDRKP